MYGGQIGLLNGEDFVPKFSLTVGGGVGQGMSCVKASYGYRRQVPDPANPGQFIYSVEENLRYDESPSATHLFVGAMMGFGVADVAAEVGSSAGTAIGGVSINLGF